MDFFVWGYFFPHPISGWRSFSEVLQFNSRAEKLPFDWRPLWGEKSGTGDFAKITPGVDGFFFSRILMDFVLLLCNVYIAEFFLRRFKIQYFKFKDVLMQEVIRRSLFKIQIWTLMARLFQKAAVDMPLHLYIFMLSRV